MNEQEILKLQIGQIHQEIRTIVTEMKALRQAVVKNKNKKTAIGQWFLNIKNYIFTTGQFKKKDFKNDRVIKKDQSVYPQTGQTVGAYCKRFHWVNIWLKNVIFVPGLAILNKIIGKKLDDTVEDVWYNKNIKIFNDAWIESMKTMDTYVHKGFTKHNSYILARKMALTMTVNDTITREFMNVFMHTVTSKMNAAYKGHKDVYHVFYGDVTAYNPIYFNMVKSVMVDNKHPSIVAFEKTGEQIKNMKEMLKKEKNKARKEQLKEHIANAEKQLEAMKKDTNTKVVNAGTT